MRRGVNMVYIVENNGVYGLTKGQFSATADKGSKSKRGVVNSDEPIDLAMLALTLGATFVARGFSGDKEQLIPLIKAAVMHRGAAFIDVVSPAWRSTTTRLDQELRLRARAQRRREPAGFHLVTRRDHDELRAGRDAQRDAARWRDVRLHKLNTDYDPSDRVAPCHSSSRGAPQARS
jgi:2-oxoglutarate ferredoxin oxidoreductase subunit beta